MTCIMLLRRFSFLNKFNFPRRRSHWPDLNNLMRFAFSFISKKNSRTRNRKKKCCWKQMEKMLINACIMHFFLFAARFALFFVSSCEWQNIVEEAFTCFPNGTWNFHINIDTSFVPSFVLFAFSACSPLTLPASCLRFLCAPGKHLIMGSKRETCDNFPDAFAYSEQLADAADDSHDVYWFFSGTTWI